MSQLSESYMKIVQSIARKTEDALLPKSPLMFKEIRLQPTAQYVLFCSQITILQYENMKEIWITVSWISRRNPFHLAGDLFVPFEASPFHNLHNQSTPNERF